MYTNLNILPRSEDYQHRKERGPTPSVSFSAIFASVIKSVPPFRTLCVTPASLFANFTYFTFPNPLIARRCTALHVNQIFFIAIYDLLISLRSDRSLIDCSRPGTSSFSGKSTSDRFLKFHTAHLHAFGTSFHLTASRSEISSFAPGTSPSFRLWRAWFQPPVSKLQNALRILLLLRFYIRLLAQ